MVSSTIRTLLEPRLFPKKLVRRRLKRSVALPPVGTPLHILPMGFKIILEAES